jgi:penicillin amidase
MSLTNPSPDDAAPEQEVKQEAVGAEVAPERASRRRPSRTLRIVGLIFPAFVILAVVAFFVARHYVRKAMDAALPQIDGTLRVAGLSAPVTVERDAHGVPHIHAQSMDELIFAQGFVTASDRLWQMDILRRHAAGELAEVLGSSMVEHDRIQRTLQIRAAADRAVTMLPADQMHWLEVYARGVNASIAQQRGHLPLEFLLLRYAPASWTPRDTLLVGLAMFQDLTNTFPQKLSRETLTARLPPELIADLYPVGNWRDHAPDQPILDLTLEQPEYEDAPLDPSQNLVSVPHRTTPAEDILALIRSLSLFHPTCDTCVAGSNNWAIAGSRTASGHPLLANDMHLMLTLPNLWYEAALSAPSQDSRAAEFHVAGVTLPGAPFVIVGHNAGVAWGFTNLGADVQDLYVEHLRNTGQAAEYATPGEAAWTPVVHHAEVIHVRGTADITLDVTATRHGDAETPIVSPLFPGEKRTLSLRWTIYDPANLTNPFFAVNAAQDGASVVVALASWGGPAQNLVYADRNHIGYHAVGRIPLRGAPDPTTGAANPLSPVPTDAMAADAAVHEWAGYIPYGQLPQAVDPPSGILATANARVTRDAYAFPITLNWAAPYRIERIYKVLTADPADRTAPRRNMTPADMLALEDDTFSELDLVLAQRFTYAIDHTAGKLHNDPVLRQAADILRTWKGNVDANAAAPAIVDAARAALWPMLLTPKLESHGPAQRDPDTWRLYTWGERSAVEEQIVTHAPARWLPPGYATWDDFLAAVVSRGLQEAHAPRELARWQLGKVAEIDAKHPIFSRSPILERLIGRPIGTGPLAIRGDSDTVSQHLGFLTPSERFTADLGNPDHSTLNLPLGQSANPVSPWFLDQVQNWVHGTTLPFPFTDGAAHAATAHALRLAPQ